MIIMIRLHKSEYIIKDDNQKEQLVVYGGAFVFICIIKIPICLAHMSCSH